MKELFSFIAENLKAFIEVQNHLIFTVLILCDFLVVSYVFYAEKFQSLDVTITTLYSGRVRLLIETGDKPGETRGCVVRFFCYYYYLFVLLYWGMNPGTQGLECARQSHYHLSHTANPFPF
jgi:hypothetical protein